MRKANPHKLDHESYLREKLQDLESTETWAVLHGDTAWALRCKAEARRVSAELARIESQGLPPRKG